MACHFIREQKHKCGPNYMEVDIFPITKREHKASTRSKERKATRMVQANLNAHNSKRHLVQIVNTNFTSRDLHITLTYRPCKRPKTEEDAKKDLDRYVRRVNYARKKKGLSLAKLIAVTEHQEPDPQSGKKKVEFHHHLIISGDGLSRDELEDLWSEGRGKKRKRIGLCNADRLQFDQDSLEALCNYLTQYPNRKKRWRQSIGLRQPVRPRPNDTRYSRRQVERMAKERIDDTDFWNEKYPGWELNGPVAKAIYHDRAGWYMYLRMRRIRQIN